MKLRMPDFWSSVANSAANCTRSISSPVRQIDLKAPVDGLLGGAQRQRRPGRVLGDQVPGRLVDVGVRHHLVSQADGQRLGGAHVPAGENKILGLRPGPISRGSRCVPPARG